jgi:hypothetical protein
VLRAPNEPNCLSALFLGKNNNVPQVCKRLILNSGFEAVWIRSPDSKYWIYSLSTPTQITVQCRDAGSPQAHGNSYQLTLNNTGILPNSSSCYIHSETFKLLPHSFGKSIITLVKNHIVLPNIDNILNPVEQSLLQPHFQGSTDLHAIEDIVERASSRRTTTGIDVGRIAQMVQEKQPHSSSVTQAWIFGIIAATFSLLIFVLIYLQFYSQSCVPTSQLSSILFPITRASTPSVTSDPMELQILPERTANSPDTREEVQEKSHSSTCFIQHGVLSTDA